jgi:hypothetical protein
VSRVDPVAAYRDGVVLVIAFFSAAGAVSAVLLTARAVAAPVASAPSAPAPAPAPASGDGETAAPVPVTVQTQNR